MATTQPIVARGVIRTREPWHVCTTAWRRGPDTPDGWWMVTTSRSQPWAVRVIIDPSARANEVSYPMLENALYAPTHEAQDEYLASLNVVSTLAPTDLALLRDAVLAGRTGGPADGAPRRRTRKAAAS